MGSPTYLIGLDVGSTTVKAVVLRPGEQTPVWARYQRHETRQAETALALLESLMGDLAAPSPSFRLFVTGSGGRVLAEAAGARFVQEVNAVTLAVEAGYPETGSVIELGGQDAKIIIWMRDPRTGQRRKLPSMNDKCAGGTGAVIDKIAAKLRLSPEDLARIRYHGANLHPVAGKCGVFAETDINGLQKQGVPAPDLMASLFEALVQQNLSVLTRGNTLQPKVLLLGGPNTFLPGLQEAWRHHILALWRERGVALPEGVPPEDLVVVPPNAQYFAALGAALFGQEEEGHVGRLESLEGLRDLVQRTQAGARKQRGAPALVATPEEREAFRRQYAVPPFQAPKWRSGETVAAYLGVDGGSTSTKAVLVSPQGAVLARAYRLSRGNPLEDVREVIRELQAQVQGQGAHLEILGVGTTGYAKDMLQEALQADVAIVETVAHTRSALHFFGEVDVIVDVGGQDIKVILLRDGKVRDFKLNTQCSAGNGYFLQSTAQRFGLRVEEFADRAFEARHLPLFNFGCAVFLEADVVNFQQQGWTREEILAGLAYVLPRNIWLYVVQEPNLRRLGRRFVLQGGTQHNLAAVKAQVDFIRERVPEAEIFVHPHTGEAGAIGAALEAARVVAGGRSRFMGLEAVGDLQYTVTRDESTRCHFCKNYCIRTFVDIQLPTPPQDSRRYIIATCEKGTVEDVGAVRDLQKRMAQIKKAYPNFVEIAAREAFAAYPPKGEEVRASGRSPWWSRLRFWGAPGRRGEGSGRPSVLSLWGRRGPSLDRVVIGIPRVLNFYSVAPFFIGYFQALGIPYPNLVFSDYTEEKMYKEGSRRGSIDACFPSKVALAHVHQLLFEKLPQKAGDRKILFFPILLNLPTDLVQTVDSAACPTVSATPEVVQAALTKEGDLFATQGVWYADPHLNMGEPPLFHRQMGAFARDVLGVDRRAHERAMEAGWEALRTFYQERLRARARQVLEDLEREGRIGVVLLGRPYHNDPGLNHEILEAIQKQGYPIFTVESLPTDPDLLERLFGEEVRRGEISHPLDITDVWKNAYSENTNKKIWAAKFVARHPNLVAVDLSNFRCGHDAPIYNVVEGILEATRTPHFTFHDLDENKPTGSIKLRVETIHYFLEAYRRERLLRAHTDGPQDPDAFLEPVGAASG